jgi:hypothetical protein
MNTSVLARELIAVVLAVAIFVGLLYQAVYSA